MGFLKTFAGSPAALLACLAAGALVGHFYPGLAAYATMLSQVYLGVVSMAALPLLLVATFFGLRQTMGLPHPERRVLMIAGWAAVLVAVCALVGTMVGAVAGPGRNLPSDVRGYLGSMVQASGGEAENSEMFLIAAESVGADPSEPWFLQIIPDNFFRVLADGRSLGILLCAILFGLAFAALSKSQNGALTGIFEAIYRALEIIISKVNLFIPVLVFGTAAFFTAETDANTVVAMQSFLICFVPLSLAMSGLAILVIGKRAGLPFLQVLAALKAPALISLTSSSTTASIPDTIEAMSTRLGFSRGIVELITPISSVFLRCGSALYYALLAVFVANLYGRSLTPDQLMAICAGACLASFASAGNNSFANVGFAGMVLTMLQLPVEAALALFVAIDLICEAPRNLLTLMFSCVLMALVSGGLPSERTVVADASSPQAPSVVRFAFTRSDLMIAAICSVAVMLLIIVLGIGVGMRRTADSVGWGGFPAATVAQANIETRQ
ncbi:MAG: cation:dicarboxylase symporter family transporter [Ramlibacter sp.]|nr:cation:dicarboxylase symporter family transporter [Ramlibacter sp.]